MSSSIGPIHEVQPVTAAKSIGLVSSQAGPTGHGWPAHPIAQAPETPYALAAALPERDLLMPTTSLTTLLIESGRTMPETAGQVASPPVGDLATQETIQAAARLAAGLTAGLGESLADSPKSTQDNDAALRILVVATGGSIGTENPSPAESSFPAAMPTSSQIATLLQAHHPQGLGFVAAAREMDKRRNARGRMRAWLSDAMQAKTEEAGGGRPRVGRRDAGGASTLQEDVHRLGVTARPAINIVAPAIPQLILAGEDEELVPSDEVESRSHPDPTWTVVVEFAMLGRVVIEIVCRGSCADMLLLTDYRLEPETVAFVHEMLETASILGALTTSLRTVSMPGSAA
ncbi:hypothetical protein SAMN07250955_101345 [Arboricoccus pini]|uniref:Uncharacterized protein n=1 Tax=Arboricoccus pini TaxID=1963835 RepID=A0A212Q1G0_9PROT|nr:hypothetical protein [Arboricoccus pini]SNB53136.1 hypothetical protein SAMN07250955_101345 [Arboricoccus pini]